jgi:hypothetical protein
MRSKEGSIGLVHKKVVTVFRKVVFDSCVFRLSQFGDQKEGSNHEKSQDEVGMNVPL